jgi:predicted ATPase with chaperone activity
LHNNAGFSGALLDAIATPDSAGQRMLTHAAERFHLSARGYHRMLRMAHTVADLEGCEKIARPQIQRHSAIDWHAQARPNQTPQPVPNQIYPPV